MTAQLTGPDYAQPVTVPDSLGDLIHSAAEESPDALLTELFLDGEEVRTSCAELYARSLALCEQLEDIAPDTPLILGFDRVSDFVPAAWAAIFLGRWYVPWQITSVAGASGAWRVRAGAMQKCFPVACLVTHEKQAALATEIAAQAPEWSSRTLRSSLSQSVGHGPPDVAEDGGCFMPTSGTSGGMKFARIPNQTMRIRFSAMPAQAEPRVSLTCFPFDGVTGQIVIFPWSGTRVFLHTDRLLSRPGDLPDLVENLQINALALSTTMLARFVAALEKRSGAARLASLRKISLGSEPLSRDLIRRLLTHCDRCGADHVALCLAYGMTEAGTVSRVALPTPADALAHLGDGGGPVRLDGCTRYTALRIADPDDRMKPLGQQGEIQIHSTHRLFDGYQTPEGPDRSCFTNDGWFRTGDIGVINNSQLIVLGRRSCSMLLGGRTISLEQIETELQGLEGMEPGSLVAAAFKPEEAVVDELALFFTPDPVGSIKPEQLGESLRCEVKKLIGLSPAYLVPVPPEQIPRTASAKVIRSQLVSAFQAGDLQALGSTAQEPQPATRVSKRLAQIWARQLGIDSNIPDDADFFELGADSIAVADMVLNVEDNFGIRLPLEEFFRRPTLGNLAALVESPLTEQRPRDCSAEGPPLNCLRKLESSLGSWPGTRQSPASLIAGSNPGGSAVPLFWVFQSQEEFSRLAAALGTDYPLYGLRSLEGILPVREHDSEVLNALCDLYVPEILALRPAGPLVVGGNCQGGIIALAVARRLRRLGRQPQSLVLMEWSYSWGAYEGHVELLYGAQSYTARFYTRTSEDGPNWDRDFASRAVHPIDGSHGQFFRDENIESLAGELRRICSRHD